MTKAKAEKWSEIFYKAARMRQLSAPKPRIILTDGKPLRLVYTQVVNQGDFIERFQRTYSPPNEFFYPHLKFVENLSSVDSLKKVAGSHKFFAHSINCLANEFYMAQKIDIRQYDSFYFTLGGFMLTELMLQPRVPELKIKMLDEIDKKHLDPLTYKMIFGFPKEGDINHFPLSNKEIITPSMKLKSLLLEAIDLLSPTEADYEKPLL